MSYTYTYATLTSNLQSWVENTGIKFTANLDKIIQQGELKLIRDLDLDIFDTTATASTANGVETLARPTDMVSPRSLHYTASGAVVNLLPRTYEYLKDYGGTGNPIYYAESTEANWILAPVPTSIITVTIRYIKRPSGLVEIGGSVTTSWLSANVPDALFYSCLTCCEEFLKADERIPVWAKKYAEVLAAAKLELGAKMMRSEYGSR